MVYEGLSRRVVGREDTEGGRQGDDELGRTSRRIAVRVELWRTGQAGVARTRDLRDMLRT